MCAAIILHHVGFVAEEEAALEAELERSFLDQDGEGAERED